MTPRAAAANLLQYWFSHPLTQCLSLATTRIPEQRRNEVLRVIGCCFWMFAGSKIDKNLIWIVFLASGRKFIKRQKHPKAIIGLDSAAALEQSSSPRKPGLDLNSSPKPQVECDFVFDGGLGMEVRHNIGATRETDRQKSNQPLSKIDSTPSPTFSGAVWRLHFDQDRRILENQWTMWGNPGVIKRKASQQRANLFLDDIQGGLLKDNYHCFPSTGGSTQDLRNVDFWASRWKQLEVFAS
ncbi:hypothetical protein B0H34DRAFT_675422 [Crassisporium funariophilum]|nr:hypothetical protein B0H34DRAFT_675422 [Crassisporium funariophilum]